MNYYEIKFWRNKSKFKQVLFLANDFWDAIDHVNLNYPKENIVSLTFIKKQENEKLYSNKK